MALKGTLEDFGIADILQLIGQQGKSGILHLQSREDEVHVLMADGNVVAADAGRRAKDRLGGLLLRAGLITRDDLARALDAQRRTLRRLGDLLVELELVTKQDLKDITRLQTTETVYKLFHWKSGTYEFEPGEVEFDRDTVTPLRAESVLMEGFRRIDEWPLVRKKISSPAMTFERLTPLPPPGPARASEEEEGGIGTKERRVYALVEPGRTAEAIADLSRLGEFEASKALFNLLNRGIVKANPAPRRSRAAAVGAAYARSWRESLHAGAAGALATIAIAAVLASLAWLGLERVGTGSAGIREPAVQQFLSRYGQARLSEALEVHRLERGEYPESLASLEEEGLATREDLHGPWYEGYHYRRKAEGGFVLLPPIE
jgi:predicted transcriptional regulator